jgi:hypothetical protein
VGRRRSAATPPRAMYSTLREFHVAGFGMIFQSLYDKVALSDKGLFTEGTVFIKAGY